MPASATPAFENRPYSWVGPGPGGKGVRLRIRAVPGARRDAISGRHGDALRVAVRAPADRGQANAALVEFLSRALGVARRSVGVVAGHTGRDKIGVVEGLDEVVARERLEALLPAVPGEDLGGSLP